MGGFLTKEQVTAIADRERRLYGDGGDVAKQLPALKVKMATEVYSQLLPGYVRQFVQDAAPLLSLKLAPMEENRFRLVPAKPRAPDPLLPMLEAKTGDHFEITFSRPDGGGRAGVGLSGRTGFRSALRLVNFAPMPEARRGAVVVDPSSTHSYLLHLASVTILRRADPSLVALKATKCLNNPSWRYASMRMGR